MAKNDNLKDIARLIRYFSLVSTSAAGSGHPTSSMSATDLMTVLMFGGHFRFSVNNQKFPNNDRLIFSKGHASPLFYSLWAVAGKVSEKDLMELRKFGSPLEGHPTMEFAYTEAATGSLGQGLSVGVGMAMNAKYVDRLSYKTFVLLGDSEMAEGSVWEAAQLAAHYKLDNLVAIVDVNRLGQRGPTMYEHDLVDYKKKLLSFGWHVITLDGHNISKIDAAYKSAQKVKSKPVAIVARTKKGKGVKFLEDKNGWHGKALKEKDLQKALKDLGDVDTSLRAKILEPKWKKPKKYVGAARKKIAITNEALATRKAYGQALVNIFPKYKNSMVVLDAEVSNSTYSEIFKKAYPKRFFEMFIAEQNMVGASIGFSRRDKLPFVSTFAAFFTRAFDQIRMSQYSDANIKFVGSHAGVSIGEDGASQMALEDLAMFRTLHNSVVLYPSDSVSTHKLVEQMARHKGITYMRTTRASTPVLYKKSDSFPIGGSKVIKQSARDDVTVVTAGITLFEALKAYEELKQSKIIIRIVDLYSIKPVDEKMLHKAAMETQALLTVEDHYPQGGIGEAVRSAVSGARIHSLAVHKIPLSGTPEELLDYEEISADAIIRKVKEIMGK